MSQSYAFDSESDSESGFADWGMPSPERLKDDAERVELQRATAIERARRRRNYWATELAAERFEEFRVEMARRVAVEDETISQLESGELLIRVLRQHQAEAVHHRAAELGIDATARERIQNAITLVSTKQRKLKDELNHTPRKMVQKVNQILTELDDLDDELVVLKGKLRKLN